MIGLLLFVVLQINPPVVAGQIIKATQSKPALTRADSIVERIELKLARLDSLMKRDSIRKAASQSETNNGRRKRR